MADTDTLSLFDDETLSAAPKKKKSRGRGGATTKSKSKTKAKGKSKTRAKASKSKSKSKTTRKTTESESPKAASTGTSEPKAKATNGTRSYQTAQTLASKQREISVSEFFAKNRHMLGFDSPSRAILTAVKEAVDNSLDACEEAGILPDILVEIKELSDDRYKLVFEDSGPGIVKAQIPKIFGKLLYGSKFHQLKQTRGQQGIGISAAVMYAQLTTGKPVIITSRTGKKYSAHRYELQIDTKKNAPQIVAEKEVDWEREHGTRVEMEIEATYKKGKRSVDQFMHQVALANPHADIRYVPPKGDPEHYERVTQDLPPEPIAIKPHPHGVELGIVMDMLAATKARTATAFLTNEFSRMSNKNSQEALDLAGVKPRTHPKKINRDQAEAMLKAFKKVKIMKPPTNCLSPMGEEVLAKSMQREYEAEFYDAVTRPPAVYRGNPFQIEVAIAYGVKDMPADELVQLHRFANRAPLIYQQNACALTSSVVGTGWKSYGLNQSKGALPTGAMVIMVQIESVWVPFTSESKEAVAHYPEIIKETKLALQESGRRLQRFIRKGMREREEAKKRSYIEKYIPHIGIALKEILGISEREEKKIVDTLTDTLEKSRKL